MALALLIKIKNNATSLLKVIPTKDANQEQRLAIMIIIMVQIPVMPKKILHIFILGIVSQLRMMINAKKKVTERVLQKKE